ncbi:hypothetical protein M0P65_07870 [Candidatus Gracilibacteria bacterium]|jgi:hypothetical protein|nr:hypothetical protein [Candidatus Gracilibacteria bacterium]
MNIEEGKKYYFLDITIDSNSEQKIPFGSEVIVIKNQNDSVLIESQNKIRVFSDSSLLAEINMKNKRKINEINSILIQIKKLENNLERLLNKF